MRPARAHAGRRSGTRARRDSYRTDLQAERRLCGDCNVSYRQIVAIGSPDGAEITLRRLIMANFPPGPERDKRLEWLARGVSGRLEAMRALKLLESDPTDDLQPPQGGRCAKAQSRVIPGAEKCQ
jgi:hypothetical protein